MHQLLVREICPVRTIACFYNSITKDINLYKKNVGVHTGPRTNNSQPKLQA